MHISIQKIKYLGILFICLQLSFACKQNSKSTIDVEIIENATEVEESEVDIKTDSIVEEVEVIEVETVEEEKEVVPEKIEEKPKKPTSSGSSPKPKSFGLKVGAEFPDFELKDINGNSLSSKDLKGKVIVFNFWFTSCKPCRDEIPELNLLVKQFSKRDDVVFIAPSFESKAKIEQFISKQNFDYQLVDNALNYNKSIGVKTYPVHLIIDKENKIHTIVTQQYPTIKDIMANYIFNAIDGRQNDKKFEG